MAAPVFATNDVPTAAQVNDWFVGVNYVRKASQTDRATTTTLADDPELTLAVVANAVYIAEIALFYQSQTATDLKFQFTAPASATFRYALNGLHSSTATTYADDQSAALDLASVATVSGIGSTLTGVLCRGLLRTSGTSGNFKLQWAQNTSGASTSMLVDSYMDLRRVS